VTACGPGQVETHAAINRSATVAAGCNMDNTMIADKQMFTSFCKTVGKAP
jgi:hypothetical protein